MKKYIFLSCALATALCAGATDFDLKKAGFDDEKTEKQDTVETYKFKDIKVVKTTPVKDQAKSGTCWSFSGLSFVEDEIMHNGGPELDLSEMFVVNHCYRDKADKYIRMDGKINFAQGGAIGDVLYVWDRYGIVPEEAYTGLQYGEDKHSHYEMADGLEGYLNGVARKSNKKLSTAWQKGFNAIVDSYLGTLPEEFTYNGKKYTPKSFAQSLPFNTDDYISITSFTHHPWYEPFALEIADNWLWDKSMNVPMEDMKAIIDNALENGYSVAWAADVSEGGFKWRDGFAVIPAAKDEADMEGTELSRWVALTAKEKENARYDVKGPCKEITVTQESRQEGFDNKETTDDHGMVIVGIAEDQEGNRFYKVKNSWDTDQVYGGYIYVSEPFMLAKTINVMVNKKAVPASIAKKFKK